MNIYLTNIYIFILATVLAILEIQIEGANGWAKNLPTWRPNPNHPMAKIYSRMMSGKELTGYHLTMFSFVFLIFNLPFFFGFPFNLENILKISSLFFIFIALWDFLWFVLNPFHPLKNFAKNNPNHKAFLFGMPTDYYYSITISFLILVIPTLFTSHLSLITSLNWWLTNMGMFILETIFMIIFSLYILDIDNWQK